MTAVDEIRLGPGDVVVLRVDILGFADGFYAALKKAFPDNEVLILDRSASLEIWRPT